MSARGWERCGAPHPNAFPRRREKEDVLQHDCSKLLQLTFVQRQYDHAGHHVDDCECNVGWCCFEHLEPIELRRQFQEEVASEPHVGDSILVPSIGEHYDKDNQPPTASPSRRKVSATFKMFWAVCGAFLRLMTPNAPRQASPTPNPHATHWSVVGSAPGRIRG